MNAVANTGCMAHRYSGPVQVHRVHRARWRSVVLARRRHRLHSTAAATAAAAVAIDSRECVLAIDVGPSAVGTTALKAMLLRPDGAVVAEAEKRYRTPTVSPEGVPGAMEQNPDDWVQAFAEAAAEILASSSSSSSFSSAPAAVALSGQMQDVCLVRGGRSVRPVLLYSDVRATREAEDIARHLGPERVAAELSNFKGAAACLSKWLWLRRHEPESLEAAEHVLLGAHSYLAYVLTGGEAVACDTTTASTTGLLRPPELRSGSQLSKTQLSTSAPPGPTKKKNQAQAQAEAAAAAIAAEGGAGVHEVVEPPRWAEDAVSSFEGLDPSLLPRLIDGAAPAPVGMISREVLEALKLPDSLAGVPVFHGVVGGGQRESMGVDGTLAPSSDCPLAL